MSVDYDRTIPAAAHGGRFPNDPPAFDAVHSTEGPMSDGNDIALAQWFAKSKANGGPGTSATGIFSPSGSVRMLDEHTVPYHVGPDGNALCTGDEHCGSVNLTAAQWMSTRAQAMLNASAKVKAQRAIFRGWKLSDCRWLSLTEVARRTVRGFCTHNDVRLALGGTTHSDPGPNFPYSWYMGRIRFWFLTLTGALPEEDEDVPNTENEIKTWVNDCIENKFGLKSGENMSLAVFGATSNKDVFNRMVATNNPASLASMLLSLVTATTQLTTLVSGMKAELSDDEADIVANANARAADILAAIEADEPAPPTV